MSRRRAVQDTHLRHLPRWESIRTATLGFAVVAAPARWDAAGGGRGGGGGVGRRRGAAPGGGGAGGRWLASRRRLASCYFSFSQALTQTSSRSCRAEQERRRRSQAVRTERPKCRHLICVEGGAPSAQSKRMPGTSQFAQTILILDAELVFASLI